MAFKTTRMNQVKSILKDLSEGEPIKKTARIHKVSKNTVKKYLTIFKSSGLDVSQLEKIPDDVFHNLFYIQPSKNDCILQRSVDLKQRLPWIVNELGRKDVTRELIYQQYIIDYPTGYSYSRFCRKLKEL